MKKFLFFTIAITPLLFISCDKQEYDTESLDDGIALGDAVISSATRAGGTYTDYTYRFCLFNTTTHFYNALYGTYCDPNPSKDSRWLTPCKVNDATGAYDNTVADPEAGIYGLQARNGTYYMAIASPAVAMQNTTKADIYGFHYYRERQAGEKVLCISDSIKVTISGLNINNAWIYYVNDTIRLKERRSKLKVSVSCGDDISSAMIKKIGLSNIVNEGWYRPIDYDFEYLPTNIGSTDIQEWATALTLYQTEDTEAGHEKTVECTSQPYLLSMDYSKTDAYSNPVYALPSIDLYLGASGETEVKVPIAYNLLPEYTYSCHITINSCYVQVTLSVLDWEGPHTVTGGTDNLLQRPLTFTVNTWDDGTGTSGETEIHDSAW